MNEALAENLKGTFNIKLKIKSVNKAQFNMFQTSLKAGTLVIEINPNTL